MKPEKPKIYAHILCNAFGTPFKMIIVMQNDTQEIPISNTSLKTVKKAAYDVYGVTDLYISLIQDEPPGS